MKRKRIALFMALAMTVTSLPANSLMVSAAEETDGFIAGDEISAEVESSEDAADGFVVEEAAPDASEAGAEAFESADAEGGFTSDKGAAGAEADFQAVEETQETEDLVAPESVEVDYSVDNWFQVEVPERVELSSSAYSPDGLALTYQWYKSNYDEDFSKAVMIEGATSSVYVIESAEKSNQYYCVATDTEGNSEDEAYKVCVKSIAFEDGWNSNQISVKAHGQAVLKSTAYSMLGNKLKYQWSKWNEEENDYEVIEGADQSTLVVDDITEKSAYRCWLDDDGYECGEWFHVNIDSGLKKDESDNEIDLEFGESTTLVTSIKADDGVPLSYQWFKMESEEEIYKEVEIVGETRSELTVGPLDGKMTYICRVSDPYGNSMNEYFYMRLRNTLQIEGDTWKEIKTDFKGTVELSVSASSKLTNKLSYHWYYQAEDGETVELEEASGKNSFKVENVVKREFYYCSVDDGNESRTFSFSISVNSGLEIDYDATESYFEVDYGKSVTMETVAAANPGVELKYQWYVLDKYDEMQIIPGANQKTYTIDKAEEGKEYICEVSDLYGNQVDKQFEVEVHRILVDRWNTRITIDPGENVELSFTAKSAAGEKLTYQWYKQITEDGEYSLIEGETTDKLTVSDLFANTNFYCEVRDEKISQNVWFEVQVDSCIIFKNEENYITGKVGTKATIDAEAIAESGKTLNYQWYKYVLVQEDVDDEGYYTYKAIDGATEPTYEVTIQDYDEEYLCKVTDSTGGITKRTFSVEKSSELPFVDDKQISVNVGDDVVLKTDISGGEGAKLTYQWYCYDKEKESYALIEGATEASYEVKNVTKQMDYYCRVNSEKNCSEQYFSVKINNGFNLKCATDNYYTVKSGAEMVILDVAAESNDSLSYEWYVHSDNSELESNWVKIENATRRFYSVHVTTPWSSYKCKVSDKYNSAIVYFELNAVPDLTVSAEENVWVEKGADAVLSVKTIKGANCEKIKYQWFKFTPNGGSGEWTKLTDAVKDTYTVKNVNTLQEYRCVVYDDYGCGTDAKILVGPETLKKKAAADSANAIALVKDNRTKVTIDFSGGYKFYKFVPDQSGIWQIRSMSNMVTWAWLYDDQMNELTSSNADVYYSRTFNIQYSLEKGKTYYLKCGRGDFYNGKSFLMEASFVKEDVHKHVWNAGTVKTAATCAKAGTKVYTCTGCGQTKEETIPATGKHNMVTKIDKAATCGAAGSQHKECSVCGKKDAATAIPATGKHSFSEYTVTKAPTVLAAGVKTRTCKVCGKTETAVVAKLNGTIKVVSAKVPLQLKKKVALGKLVTGFTTGDSINAAACTSSKPSIAVISGGNVVAKKAGTTVITVKLASGASAQVTVVVQKKAVATSSITVPSTVNLTTGEKLKLTPVVSPVTSLNKVSYTSTNKKVATVTKNGVITAKKSGTATIKVKSGKKTKNVKVKVAKKAPTGMTGVPATKTLKKGKSFTIKAKLTPSGAEATIKYSSSNKKIATVNSKGKVTAKKAGTVTITVKAGNVTKTCVVTVKK